MGSTSSCLPQSLSIIIPWVASSELTAGVLKTQEIGLKMKVFKEKKVSLFASGFKTFLCTWVMFSRFLFCHFHCKTRGSLVCARIEDYRENVNIVELGIKLDLQFHTGLSHDYLDLLESTKGLGHVLSKASSHILLS